MKNFVMPRKNIIQIGKGNSSLKCRNKEMPLRTGTKFDKAEYEEKLNEYYEKCFPIISRQVFRNTIID